MIRSIFIGLSLLFSVEALQVNRVILGCDSNPMYLEFWPHVARAWKVLVGVQPTLILVAEDDVEIDTSLGDVIRFKPIPGLSTACQAQCIRLLAPLYFENDVCILSDMDMIPLCRDYFTKTTLRVPDNHFAVFRHKYDDVYPMCYNAMKGSTIRDLFEISSVDEIPKLLTKWIERGFGWNTDQIVLTECLEAWSKKTNRVTFLNLGYDRRVDRANWGYDDKLLKSHYYIDAHLLRPLSLYPNETLRLMQLLGL